MIYGILITLAISTIVAILWGKGIIKMKRKFPDYKATEFLFWDDNKVHTENDF